jgi:hypothetical protein
VAIDLDEIFGRGGKELIDLLDHAVRAVATDVVFLFLVEEYRMAPTAAKAVALYDVFCAPDALARLSSTDRLPPASFHIDVSLRALRQNLSQRQQSQSQGLTLAPLMLPPKFLFDAIANDVRKNSASLRRLKRRYRPERTPAANLPGGRMNAGQRFFVEKVWELNLRPRLVSTGFRRIGSIA